ncbi:DUF1640 domain-containing protein [Symbiopectobacterium purcellii]|uniref:DUF1640 domain-containing protein n=1 Tax=Symbiopectobacterium purcellii TaxID=2871826 RepID=UPI003F82BE78
MATLVFDTHAFVKKLTTAGMPEAQAEILAQEQANLIENRLATKLDIVTLEKNIEMQLSKIRSDVDTKIETTKSDIIKWVAGLLIAQAALVATLLKLFTGA